MLIACGLLEIYLNFKSPSSSTILIIVDSSSLLLFVSATYVSMKTFVMVARIYMINL